MEVSGFVHTLLRLKSPIINYIHKNVLSFISVTSNKKFKNFNYFKPCLHHKSKCPPNGSVFSASTVALSCLLNSSLVSFISNRLYWAFMESGFRAHEPPESLDVAFAELYTGMLMRQKPLIVFSL